MHYPSKRSTLFGVITVAAMLFLLVSAFFVASVMSMLFVGGAALMGWVFWGTWYVLGEEKLHIRSGPFRWDIPYQEINYVKATRNMISSPATSLDRLEIQYGKGGFVLISPVEKEEFFRLLMARCPKARFPKKDDGGII